MHASVKGSAIAAAAFLGLVILSPGYAAADGGGSVDCGRLGCGIGVVETGNGGGSDGTGGGETQPVGDSGNGSGGSGGSGEVKNPNAGACQWRAMRPQPDAGSPLWEGHSAKDGQVEFFMCDDGMMDPSGRGASQFRFSSTAPAGPTPQEIAATLAQQARGQLVMPSLQVQVGPDKSQLAVKVPVWFWLDRAQVGVEPKTVSAGAVSVTARAELVSMTVSPGEWRSKTAGAAGGFVDAFDCAGDAMFAAPRSSSVSWQQKPLCGYTYGYRSDKNRTDGRGTWQATVTAHWRVTWTSTGAGGVGGVIDVPPASTVWPLQIGEWRAIGVAPTS